MKKPKQYRIRILLLLLFVCFFTLLNAQSRKFQNALDQFHQSKYKSALRIVDHILKKDSSNMDAWVLKGNIHEEQQQIKEAILAYNTLIQSGSLKFIESCIHSIDLQISINQFESAIDHCFSLMNLSGLSKEQLKEITHLRELAEFRNSSYQNPVDFNPINLGPEINTEAYEYVNAFDDHAAQILFTRKWAMAGVVNESNYEEQLYTALKDSLSWKTILLQDISKSQNHRLGASTLSSDHRYLIFTACYRPDGYGNCDLYYIDLWADSLVFQNMGPKINTSAWESQAFFAADGKSLYFASKRKGGYGGSDLWICRLDDNGRWSEAQNLGPLINTDQDEMAPFMHPDLKNFYFSSKGHIGMGGFDLFKSTLNQNNFSHPKNLGYPINTKLDELNLIIKNNGYEAFISSDREHAFGGTDIYTFSLDPEFRASTIHSLIGKIIDHKSKEFLEAKVSINDPHSTHLIARALSNKKNGLFNLEIADTLLQLQIEKDNYVFFTKNIDNSILHNDTLIFELQKIEVGALVKLENIYFNTNRYEILKPSHTTLSKLVYFLQQNSSLSIEIGGHTDDIGSYNYNIELSKKRAESVRQYLITNGISASRIQSQGYGFTQPIDSNDSEVNRASNRRTEIKIIGI